MTEYKEKDINKMSWEEFESLANSLIKQVNVYFDSNGEKIDLITPLHRTGGIVGGYIAIKMVQIIRFVLVMGLMFWMERLLE